MERKGRGVRAESFIALGGSTGCFVAAIRPEHHGDLPICSDSKGCHPSVLEPGGKAKQPQKLKVPGHGALSLASDGMCTRRKGPGLEE